MRSRIATLRSQKSAPVRRAIVLYIALHTLLSAVCSLCDCPVASVAIRSRIMEFVCVSGHDNDEPTVRAPETDT